MKKAIIIGASSGIGEALASILSKNDYQLGLIARRKNLLLELQKDLPTKSHIKIIDITKTKEATELLLQLIDEMGGVDLAIINAGTGSSTSCLDWGKEKLNWEKEKTTIDTNVLGFTAMAMSFYHYFLKKKSGHIVGISSIAALFPNPKTPAYSASKAFVSNYLEGLKIHAYKSKLPITITDIKPGWVDTKMAKGKNVFWVASTQTAAKQIYKAIEKKKNNAFVTKRWGFLAVIAKIVPKSLYKLFF
jgi:short-subunit dehydrogenase